MSTAEITADHLRRYAVDPMAFFADVNIPGMGSEVRLGDAWAPFQVGAFQVLGRCLQAVAVGQKPEYRGLWIERTKGASKDSDVGLALLWLLLFSRRPQLVELGADDFDQIKETSKAMATVIRCNPWMAQRLAVQTNRILCESTASECVFLTRDAFGAHGSRPTVTVCNELAHCQSEDFISTMMDNADKIPNNLAILATNAGNTDTWQFRWRENYRTDPACWFQKVTDPAPWIDPAKVADAKRRNSPSRYARLWQGLWVPGGGDALDPGDIEAAVTLPGPILQRDNLEGATLGLDLGIKRDHSAAVVLLTDHFRRRIKVAWCESWAPAACGGQVDLERVWQGILWCREKWRLNSMCYDPWQAEFMAQKARALGIDANPVMFSGEGAARMASTLLEAFRSRCIDLYNEPALLRDLSRLSIQERPGGASYKLVAPRDENGHADRAMAMAIALPLAWQAIGEVVYVNQ